MIFSSYISISPELSSPHTPVSREMQFWKFPATQEDPTRSRGSSYCGDNSERARTCAHHCFWLIALLRWRVQCGPSRHHCCCCCLGKNRPVRGKTHAIFFKVGARYRASVDGKKNRMLRPAIVHSYCCYYSHHAIVITTAVTTVAMENRTTMHAIFYYASIRSLSTGAVFGTVFRYWRRSL